MLEDNRSPRQWATRWKRSKSWPWHHWPSPESEKMQQRCALKTYSSVKSHSASNLLRFTPEMLVQKKPSCPQKGIDCHTEQDVMVVRPQRWSEGGKNFRDQRTSPRRQANMVFVLKHYSMFWQLEHAGNNIATTNSHFGHKHTLTVAGVSLLGNLKLANTAQKLQVFFLPLKQHAAREESLRRQMHNPLVGFLPAAWRVQFLRARRAGLHHH